MGNLAQLASLVFVAILAAVSSQPRAGGSTLPARLCRVKSIDERAEWRELSAGQRKSYIDSVLCLQSKPPKGKGGKATNRFEEFQETHINLTPRIHVVGQFLPWHRGFVTLYTNALRNECGYKGPTPYWDWTIEGDSSKPLAESPIFDAVTGFGGDGVSGTYTLPPDPNNVNSAPGPPFNPQNWKGCVKDGPFKDTKFHLGPHLLTGEHCLVRSLSDGFKKNVNSESVAKLMAAKNFDEFSVILEDLGTGAHPGGHFMIGGEMADPYSSPGDPLFYLHHANLDRLWWKWQAANVGRRTYEISGPTTAFGKTQVTLDYVLDFPNLGRNLTIRDTMNSAVEPNCFVY